MIHQQKIDALEKSGFKYNIYHMCYVNINKKVSMSVEFVEKSPLFEFALSFTDYLSEEQIKKLGWGIWTLKPMSDKMREEFVEVLNSIPTPEHVALYI